MTSQLSSARGDEYPYKQAAKKAYAGVLALGLPDEIKIGPFSQALGKGHQDLGEEAVSKLSHGPFGNDLPKVLGVALKSYWYACFKTAFMLDLSYEIAPPTDSSKSLLALCVGDERTLRDPFTVVYLEISSMEDLEDHNLTTLATNAGLNQCPDMDDLLLAIGCLFLYVAGTYLDDHLRGDNDTVPHFAITRSLDLVADAQKFFSLEGANAMWSEGIKHAEETAHLLASEGSSTDAPRNQEEIETRLRKNAASTLAKFRHAENYALAEDVEKYWRANIDPALSAQKAADQLILDRVVPLSHKKIAEIISRLRRGEVIRTQ